MKYCVLFFALLCYAAAPENVFPVEEKMCTGIYRKESMGDSISLQVPAAEPSLSELIQGIPPELQEMIYKEYQAIKKRQKEVLKQREAVGWDEVHNNLLCSPFCEKNERVTKVDICRKCKSCGRNGLCCVCLKVGKKKTLYPSVRVGVRLTKNPPTYATSNKQTVSRRHIKPRQWIPVFIAGRSRDFHDALPSDVTYLFQIGRCDKLNKEIAKGLSKCNHFFFGVYYNGAKILLYFSQMNAGISMQ